MSNPPTELPRCCAQVSITVAPQVNEKTRQKHDYAGPAHRDSYARRTAAERTYASLADPSVGGIRRGWCRLFGRAKNTLMYALAVVVRNVRIVESFERREAQEARATIHRSYSASQKASSSATPRPRPSSRCPRFQPLPDSGHRSRALRGASTKNLLHPYFLAGHHRSQGAHAPKTRPCHTRMLDSHPGHRLR